MSVCWGGGVRVFCVEGWGVRMLVCGGVGGEGVSVWRGGG